MTEVAGPPDLVAAVRAHAVDNYESDGWDFVVECWTDADIAERIEGITTPEAAIAAVGEIAGLLDEQRSEVRAEIF